METPNFFKNLPNEIAIGIFRDYFTFDEKVSLMKDDIFWPYLSDHYSWKTKPKISLKSLKGACENLLNGLEEGFYVQRDLPAVYKITKNSRRGVINVELFKGKIAIKKPIQTRPKLVNTIISIDKLKELYHLINSRCVRLNHSLFADKFGEYSIALDQTYVDNLAMRTLTKIDETSHFIFKAPRYFVFFRAHKKYAATEPAIFIELKSLLIRMLFTNCTKVMRSKNYIACKMLPWRESFKSVLKMNLSFLSRSNTIKATIRKKL